jgi:hypothetical protein
LALLAPVTSRHRPDCVPVMVPSELTAHRWFAPPLQVQISTLVPGVVWLLKASRHFWLLPLQTVSWPEARVQIWLLAPLQVQMSS